MESETKNKHGETPEETEEYIKELEGLVYSNNILLKFILSTVFILSYAIARVSLWWLTTFAASGSGALSVHESTLGTSFLVLGHNLSYVFCLVFMTVALLVLLMKIWERELVVSSQKLQVAFNGASKELSKDSKKED